jgi:hypothetical protein
MDIDEALWYIREANRKINKNLERGRRIHKAEMIEKTRNDQAAKTRVKKRGWKQETGTDSNRAMARQDTHTRR